MIMRNIPEFDEVKVSYHGECVYMHFRWGNYGWGISGISEADCINSMIDHFTKRSY